MRIQLYIVGLLLFLAIADALVAQDHFVQEKGANPQDLAAILQNTEASIYQKTMACKMAALQGKSDVVPVLAKYLGDAKLSHSVRIALRQIPGPEAGTALCAALSTVKDEKLLPGILRTIGERREPVAVASVCPFLDNKNTSVFSAASFALGSIAGKDSFSALKQAWSKANIDRKTILVPALIACVAKADQVAKRDAIDICETIKNTKELLPRLRAVAFNRQFILSDETQKYDLLTEAFAAPEKELFAVGLQTGQRLSQEKVVSKLLSGFDSYSPARQKIVMDYIRSGKNKAAADFFYKIATDRKESNIQKRIEALRTLRIVGDASYADGLFKSAEQAAKDRVPWDVVVTHLTCLSGIDDSKLDEIAISMLEKKEGFLRSFMLNLAAGRHLKKAIPIFLEELSTSKDKWDRIASVSGCRNTMSPDQLGTLLDLLKDRPKENQESIREAMLAIVDSTNDKEFAAKEIVKIIPRADTATKVTLYSALTKTKSRTALKVFHKAILENNVEFQDEVLKALGEWPNFEAEPVLFDAVKRLKSEKLQIRVVRAYIRLIRQMQLGGEHRVILANKIQPYIKRTDEQKLLIEALGRADSKSAIKFVMPYLDKPEFKEIGCIALFEIGKRLNINDPEVNSVLKKVAGLTSNASLKEQIDDLLKGTVVQRH